MKDWHIEKAARVIHGTCLLILIARRDPATNCGTYLDPYYDILWNTTKLYCDACGAEGLPWTPDLVEEIFRDPVSWRIALAKMGGGHILYRYYDSPPDQQPPALNDP